MHTPTHTAAAAAGFDSHDVHVNPDKTKLSFALQLQQPAADAPGGAAVMPATVWRSGALDRCRSRSSSGNHCILTVYNIACNLDAA